MTSRMGITARRGQKRRRAFSLIEIMISSVSASVLIIGMAAAVRLAGRATEVPSGTQAVFEGSTAIADLADEAMHAVVITERSDRMIQFASPDITGDNVADVIRYEWSGASGAPLTRKVNHGAATTVISKVYEFNLKLNVKSKTEEFPAPVLASAETLLAELASGSTSDYDIKSDKWSGEYFSPTLPAAAKAWQPTKVSLELRKDSGSGQIKVQLCTAAADGKPTSEIVSETAVNLSSLSTSYAWKEYELTTTARLLPTDRLCIIVPYVSGSDTGKARYVSGGVTLANHGLLESSNQGASWKRTNDKGLRFRVKGIYYTQSATPQQVTRRYATGLQITLRAGSAADTRIATQTQLANAPELLSYYAKLDFDKDPRGCDVNFDGQTDWVEASGSNSFVTGRLANNVWQARAADGVVLRSKSDQDFVQPTTIDVRCRSASYAAAGTGATATISVDRSGSTSGTLFTSVRQEADGRQTAQVYAKTASADVLLAELRSLSSDFVNLRLVVDPTADVVGVWINGVQKGTYQYERFSSGSDRCLKLSASGSNAEFDYVSIRTSDPN